MRTMRTLATPAASMRTSDYVRDRAEEEILRQEALEVRTQELSFWRLMASTRHRAIPVTPQTGGAP